MEGCSSEQELQHKRLSLYAIQQPAERVLSVVGGSRPSLGKETSDGFIEALVAQVHEASRSPPSWAARPKTDQQQRSFNVAGSQAVGSRCSGTQPPREEFACATRPLGTHCGRKRYDLGSYCATARPAQGGSGDQLSLTQPIEPCHSTHPTTLIFDLLTEQFPSNLGGSFPSQCVMSAWASPSLQSEFSYHRAHQQLSWSNCGTSTQTPYIPTTAPLIARCTTSGQPPARNGRQV